MARTSVVQAFSLLLLATVVVPAFAQDPAPLHPGLRIRVAQASAPHRLIGTLDSLGPDSLTLSIQSSGGSVAIPLEAITALEVAAGARRPLARSALYGAITGLALGTVLALASDYKCIDCVDSSGGAPIVIGFTTAIGSLFGLAVGSVTLEERWRPIHLPND